MFLDTHKKMFTDDLRLFIDTTEVAHSEDSKELLNNKFSIQSKSTWFN